MTRLSRTRCVCCWDYLGGQFEHGRCASCYRAGIAELDGNLLRRPVRIGCTIARHRELGVHAAINAKGGEVWRNRPEHSIPNSRALKMIERCGTRAQYMDYRCR